MLEKTTFIILLFAFCTLPSFASNDNLPEFDEEAIIKRLKIMPYDAVKPRYTSVVRSYLKNYTVWNRDRANRILGKRIQYFPMYEKYIQQYDLPDDLKYLSIVESALLPEAVSRVGAAGLWQFMPETAREMDLTLNKYVDERNDPEKSTDAAMRYLLRQYRHFGNWELALAAYNGGSGRVSRAIKRGRSKNFWKIKKYLPRETRNYVPAFIAACYLGKHYEDHDLTPTYPDMDWQMLTSTTVKNYVPLSKIAQLTNLTLEEVRQLNPMYKRNFIPSNVLGNYLVLPKRVMPAVEIYLEKRRGEKDVADSDEFIAQLLEFIPAKDSFYQAQTFEVTAGSTPQSMAQKLGVSVYHLLAWNTISEYQTFENEQLLLVYNVDLPEPTPELPQILPVVHFEALPSKPLNPVDEDKASKLPPNTFEREDYLYYEVSSKESLADIAAKFQGITVMDIMVLNNFRSNQIPKAGLEIRIKKL